MASKARIENLDVGKVYRYSMSIMTSENLRYEDTERKHFLWVIPTGEIYVFTDFSNGERRELTKSQIENSLYEIEVE